MAEDTSTLQDASRCNTERESGPRRANGSERADLTVERILVWADAYHAEHGTWPVVGPLAPAEAVAGAPGESWKAINHALALGLRGLAGDSSLAELLAEHRGAPPPDMSTQGLAQKIWAWEQEQFPIKGPRKRPRPRQGAQRYCPGLTIAAILAWADAHRAATGQWPNADSGPVRDAPFDVTWKAVDSALKKGNRGLTGGSTLLSLLKEQRGLWPELTVERILAWADAHHAALGRWPLSSSGRVLQAPGETWRTLNDFLNKGGRGLPGGQSLCGVLTEHRGVRRGQTMRPWSVAQILTWADAYHAAQGRWPSALSGPVEPGVRTNWRMISKALRKGRNGLPGGTTLERLIVEHRGPEARNRPAPLTLEQVRAWVEAHRAATGKWPTTESGPVRDAPHEETWSAINTALNRGQRGLPSGLSLARLRPDHVAVRPPLTIAQVLSWADAHHAALGDWPTHLSGKVKGTSGESWATIYDHLRYGGRGLPGGETLGSVLAAHRGVRNLRFLPRLSVEQVLAWADAHLAAHGVWPRFLSGPVDFVPGETWAGIGHALRKGQRGLPGPTTLVRLLVEHGHRKAWGRSPELTEEQILAWADAHHAATGHWPKVQSGGIAGTRGETWNNIDNALRMGNRGLPKGSSLARLLDGRRGVPNLLAQRRLTHEQILAWAEAHHAATGQWPKRRSGPVQGAPGERWRSIDNALSRGHRGLTGGMSLAALIRRRLDPTAPLRRPNLTVDQILAWADAHHAATGNWPSTSSGAIPGAPGQTWRNLDGALRQGSRGLTPGSSLRRLLVRHRNVTASGVPRSGDERL